MQCERIDENVPVAKRGEIDIIFYHGNCTDGVASAWVYKNYLKTQEGNIENVQFMPVFYGKQAPNVNGKNIAIFDFSWKSDILIEMIKQCKSYILIDHHKTAIENLHLLFYHKDKDLGEAILIGSKIQNEEEINEEDVQSLSELNFNEHFIIDMNYCGCVLVWKWLYGNLNNLPLFLKYIQDRDLWKWELPNSREFSTGFFYKAEWSKIFKTFDEIFETELTEKLYVDLFIESGKNFKIVLDKDNNRIAKSSHGFFWNPYHDKNLTLKIQIVNHSTSYSDIGEKILEIYPHSDIACVWTFKPWDKTWDFHLRSRTSESVDVSKIAKFFSGGGHLHASSFKLKFDDSIAMDWINESIHPYKYYNEELSEKKRKIESC